MAQMMGGFFLGALLMVVLYIIVYALALGATTFAVSDLYLGRQATVRSAYRNMRGRYRSLLGLIFIILVVLVCCYLFLEVIGALVWFVLAFFLRLCVVLVGIVAVVGIS